MTNLRIGQIQRTPIAQDFRRCRYCRHGYFHSSTDRRDIACPECGEVVCWDGSELPVRWVIDITENEDEYTL